MIFPSGNWIHLASFDVIKSFKIFIHTSLLTKMHCLIILSRRDVFVSAFLDGLAWGSAAESPLKSFENACACRKVGFRKNAPPL